MDIKTTHTLTIEDAEKALLARAVRKLHEDLRLRLDGIEGKPEFARSAAAHRADVDALTRLHAQLSAA